MPSIQSSLRIQLPNPPSPSPSPQHYECLHPLPYSNVWLYSTLSFIILSLILPLPSNTCSCTKTRAAEEVATLMQINISLVVNLGRICLKSLFDTYTQHSPTPIYLHRYKGHIILYLCQIGHCSNLLHDGQDDMFYCIVYMFATKIKQK